MSGRVVVIAVDDRDHSKYAFDWFLHNVYKDGDEIAVCHIPESPKLPTFTFKGGLSLPTEDWTKALEDVRDKSNKLQSNYEYELRNRNITKFCFVGEHHTKAGKGIIEAAAHAKADLVVMGTRSLDAVNRAVRGSVSDYVCRNSGIPVLIIPMKKD